LDNLRTLKAQGKVADDNLRSLDGIERFFETLKTYEAAKASKTKAASKRKVRSLFFRRTVS
jgi:hypothetical protein